MRIALFSDTYAPDVNGVVSSLITLQKQLEAMGHDVFVITNHKALTMKKEGNIIHLPGLELRWLYGYKLSTPYHFAAKDAISAMNLDVIHVHTEFGVGFFGRIVARHLNIPLVSTYHTMYEDYTHYWNKFHISEVDRASKKFLSAFSRAISDNAQAVISPSIKTKETLLKYGVKTPIYVIPTGLNFSIFARKNLDESKLQNMKDHFGILPDDKVVIFVGRVAEEKSIDIPIKAMQYINEMHIKMMIVGDGPQLPTLKQLAKKIGAEDRVIFTGKIAREDVANYYGLANAFVSASLSETQGMTFLEAMAASLPLFARKDDVLSELLIEEKNGYYFSDEQDFATKLVSYFNQAEQVHLQFQKAALKQTTPFDAKIFASKVISVYYQAIEDYKNAYEISKIKRSNDYMRIYFKNDFEDDSSTILVEMSDYYLFKMEVNTKLDRFTVAELKRKDQRIHAYRACVRKLSNADHSSGELFGYLKRILNMPDAEIKSILQELEDKGYINDDRYMKERIEKLQYRFMGKAYIERNLYKKGFDSAMISEELAKIDDDQEMARAKKMALSIIHTLKDTSKYMVQQKLVKKLISFGFAPSIAMKTLEDLPAINVDEQAALSKHFLKAVRQYKRKESGEACKEKVISTLLKKKFNYDDIIALCDTIDWEVNKS